MSLPIIVDEPTNNEFQIVTSSDTDIRSVVMPPLADIIPVCVAVPVTANDVSVATPVTSSVPGIVTLVASATGVPASPLPVIFVPVKTLLMYPVKSTLAFNIARSVLYLVLVVVLVVRTAIVPLVIPDVVAANLNTT